MKLIIKKFILLIMSWTNMFYPKHKKHILFLSYPDMTDNSFALFKYMLEHGYSEFKYTWLIQDPSSVELYKRMMIKNISVDEKEINKVKFLKKNSLKGFLAYCNAKYLFFTHGFFIGVEIPDSQIHVNLWHGMPLKSIAYLDKSKTDESIVNCTYIISTSSLFQKLMASAFRLSTKYVLISGQPRCDLLFTEKPSILSLFSIEKEKFSKILFWAPTYRRSFGTENIQDGSFRDGLPVVDIDQLSELNEIIKEMEAYLIIKLHPMDILNMYNFQDFSNISIIKNDFFLENSIQLYSLLGQVDILLTDFSSIYIDFLLTQKPIIFITEDISAYAHSRGFVFDNPTKYMPGKIVSDFKDITEVLKDLIIYDKDDYQEERKRVNLIFNEIKNDFSKILLQKLHLDNK